MTLNQKKDALIGIFDIEKGLTDINRLFIQKNIPTDTLKETNIREMKSLIVTERGASFSPVSAAALKRRLDYDARIYG